MSNKSRSIPPWSDLPPEILLKVGELTGYPIHQSRLRAVCKPWRSAFADVENRGINTFPLKIPNHPSLGFQDYNKQFIFFVSCSDDELCDSTTSGCFEGTSFLVTLDEINPGFVSPCHPFSVSNISVVGIGNSSKGLNLLENRVTFVNPGFSLSMLYVRRNVSTKDGGENKLRYDWREKSKKVVVCSNPCCDDDLLSMLYYEEKLMVLRVRDGEWKVVCDGEVFMCIDAVKFRDKIYGIDHLGGAFIIDYDYGHGNVNVVSVATPCVEGGGERARRLVVDSSSNESLYIVALMTLDNDMWLLVYRLKEDLRVWEKVNSIGDRMFFFGVNFVFCATSSDFPGLAMSCSCSLPINCIFFGKGSFPLGMYQVYGDDLLIRFNKEGTDMHIGHYCLRARRATGILDPAFVTMFSYPF